MGAIILAKSGDFYRFNSPNKILTYARFSPSTYQSGQLDFSYTHMEKGAHVIYDLPWSMSQSMSVTVIKHLAHVFKKDSWRETPQPTPQRNLCAWSMWWKITSNPKKTALLFLIYNTLFEHRFAMLCLSCNFQGTQYLKCVSAIHSYNLHFRLDF